MTPLHHASFFFFSQFAPSPSPYHMPPFQETVIVTNNRTTSQNFPSKRINGRRLLQLSNKSKSLPKLRPFTRKGGNKEGIKLTNQIGSLDKQPTEKDLGGGRADRW